MVRKIKKRKSLVTIVCDDLTALDDEGGEYFPHAGEEVTFKRKISARDLVIVSQIAEIGEIEDDKERGVEMVKFFHDTVCPILAKAIVSWNWTDVYAEKEAVLLGEPDVEALRDLDVETELQYLLDKWLDVTGSRKTGDSEKNPQQPSSEQ
jgi:hypothetical protein